MSIAINALFLILVGQIMIITEIGKHFLAWPFQLMCAFVVYYLTTYDLYRKSCTNYKFREKYKTWNMFKQNFGQAMLSFTLVMFAWQLLLFLVSLVATTSLSMGAVYFVTAILTSLATYGIHWTFNENGYLSLFFLSRAFRSIVAGVSIIMLAGYMVIRIYAETHSIALLYVTVPIGVFFAIFFGLVLIAQRWKEFVKSLADSINVWCDLVLTFKDIEEKTAKKKSIQANRLLDSYYSQYTDLPSVLRQ